MKEIVFIKSKVYAFTSSNISNEFHKYENEGNLDEYYKQVKNENNKEEKRLKGISKVTKNKISFNNFTKCLLDEKDQYEKMYAMNSVKHKMFQHEINKKSFSAFDDKRYILSDGIKTIPYCKNNELNLFS